MSSAAPKTSSQISPLLIASDRALSPQPAPSATVGHGASHAAFPLRRLTTIGIALVEQFTHLAGRDRLSAKGDSLAALAFSEVIVPVLCCPTTGSGDQGLARTAGVLKPAAIQAQLGSERMQFLARVGDQMRPSALPAPDPRGDQRVIDVDGHRGRRLALCCTACEHTTKVATVAADAK